MLRLDGKEHRLGGFDRILSTKLDEQPTSCEFELAGKDMTVRGRVSSEARQLRRLDLRRPRAGPSTTRSTARSPTSSSSVERRGRAAIRLESIGAAAYEIGMRETRPRDPAPALSGRLSLARIHRAAARAAVQRSAVLEPHPGRAQAETGAQGVAADRGRAATADDAGADDPRRLARLEHVDLLQRAREQATRAPTRSRSSESFSRQL